MLSEAEHIKDIHFSLDQILSMFVSTESLKGKEIFAQTAVTAFYNTYMGLDKNVRRYGNNAYLRRLQLYLLTFSEIYDLLSFLEHNGQQIFFEVISPDRYRLRHIDYYSAIKKER